jgi:hypothetical protein
MARKKKRRPSKKAAQAAIDEFRKKFELLDNKRKKYTPQAIERRRYDVWEMLCQDIPQTEIAGLLSVARSTVALDVKYWREKAAERVGKIKENPEFANIELGMTVQKLDACTAAAFQEYAAAKSGGEKAKFLDIITKTLSTKTRILQEAGYLPKAGIDIRTRVEHVPAFADRFGEDHPLATLDDPTSRHKLLSLAERIIKLSEKGEVIDVEGVVVKSAEPPKALEMQDEPTE